MLSKNHRLSHALKMTSASPKEPLKGDSRRTSTWRRPAMPRPRPAQAPPHLTQAQGSPASGPLAPPGYQAWPRPPRPSRISGMAPPLRRSPRPDIRLGPAPRPPGQWRCARRWRAGAPGPGLGCYSSETPSPRYSRSALSSLRIPVGPPCGPVSWASSPRSPRLRPPPRATSLASSGTPGSPLPTWPPFSRLSRGRRAASLHPACPSGCCPEAERA